jgi:hypothetical protein
MSNKLRVDKFHFMSKCLYNYEATEEILIDSVKLNGIYSCNFISNLNEPDDSYQYIETIHHKGKENIHCKRIIKFLTDHFEAKQRNYSDYPYDQEEYEYNLHESLIEHDNQMQSYGWPIEKVPNFDLLASNTNKKSSDPAAQSKVYLILRGVIHLCLLKNRDQNDEKVRQEIDSYFEDILTGKSDKISPLRVKLERLGYKFDEKTFRSALKKMPDKSKL